MKDFMEHCGKRSPTSLVQDLFCVLGNGYELNLKGLLAENYGSKEVYDFPEPSPLNYIYPWSENEQFQPFRKVAGCADVGFKETVEYFLACLEMTPDSLDRVKEWKDNIETVRSVLLDTPTIVDEFQDITKGKEFIESLKDSKDTSYGNKWDNPSDGKDSVAKVWFFDAQWSDCPEEVEKEVRQLWRDYELGNDNYMHKRELDEDLFESYPRIYFWLEHKGVQKGDEVIIHWWW